MRCIYCERTVPNHRVLFLTRALKFSTVYHKGCATKFQLMREIEARSILLAKEAQRVAREARS